NKSTLLEKIAELVREGKLTGISDLRDESDRDGMRVVVELRKDANPKVVLNQLFVHTPLQTTFGAIMLGLVRNRPQVLNLKALIDQYVEHRKSILASPKKMLGIIQDEVRRLKDKYADKRRTQIVSEEGDIGYEDTIEQKDMVITISHAGYIKRQEVSSYRSQRRGGKGVI